MNYKQKHSNHRALSVIKKSVIQIATACLYYLVDAANLYPHLPGIPYRHFCPARLPIICYQQHIRVVHEIPVPDKHRGFRTGAQ